MGTFPDISKTDFSVGGDNIEAREILDFAYDYWNSDATRRKKLEKLYRYYNGYIDENQVKYLTHITGTKSKVPYTRYLLGRSKIKLLLGEFLRMGINPTARAINPEAQTEKLNKYKSLLGISYAKPYIEKARELGYDVYNGVKIPNKDDKTVFNENNFKIMNEVVMQYIINDKVSTEDILAKTYDMFVDMIVVSEAHGKVYRSPEGIDTLKRVNPLNWLGIEQDNDPCCERSPYKGEIHYMHYHEILNEFDLTKKEKEELGNVRINGAQGCIRSTEGGVDFLIPVVRLEWKAYAPVRTKVSNDEVPYRNNLSYDYYNKNKDKIERDVKKGKYKLETKYKQTMWEGVRILNNTIYKNIREKEFVIQQRDQNGKYRARYDYFDIFFGTVNGTRISIQELIAPLEDSYDEIKYIIRKETSKIKGRNIVWDKAFTEGKQFKDIIRDITEEGLVEINSAAEGHYGAENVIGKIKPIDTIDLGPSSALPSLFNLAIDIERSMDRITGLNDDRQGVTKATTTATTNINNLEASQSMTYDIFYFVNLFINKGLTTLAEKTKINWAFLGEDGRLVPYGDDVVKYMKATKDLTNDDYLVFISDGRKEFEIKAKAERWFDTQLNNQMISTMDAIDFWRTESLGEGLNVLKRAEEKRIAYERENRDVQISMEQEKLRNARQMALENREDEQKHEIDLEIIKGEIKEGIEQTKIYGKGQMDKEKAIVENDISLANEQNQNLLTNA